MFSYFKESRYSYNEPAIFTDEGIFQGIIGVPITYLDKHNPDDFEILGIFTPAMCSEQNQL